MVSLVIIIINDKLQNSLKKLYKKLINFNALHFFNLLDKYIKKIKKE